MQQPTTIIEEQMTENDVIHSDDYAMKLVLINGLRVAPHHCNTLKLQQLLQSKGILFKTKDKAKILLKKLKDNIIAVSVHEIHDILNFPENVQKNRDELKMQILGKSPVNPDLVLTLPAEERKVKRSSSRAKKVKSIDKIEKIESGKIGSERMESTISVNESIISSLDKSVQEYVFEGSVNSTKSGFDNHGTVVSEISRQSQVSEIQNVLEQINKTSAALDKIMEKN